MSKYTVQLRYLVEQYIADAGGAGIDQDQWPLAFKRLGLASKGNIFGLSPYPIDESMREGLNKRIIQRYWNYEIGAETPAMFAMNLNGALNEIMPYYNMLLIPTIKTIQDIATETWDIARTATSSANRKTNGTTDTLSEAMNRFLDTPQGRVENLDDGYLTTASKDTANTSGNSSTDSDESATTDSTENGTRIKPMELERALKIAERIGNIQRDIVESFEVRECFMLIW